MHRPVATGGDDTLESSCMGARQFQRMAGVFGDPDIAMDPAFGQMGHESLQPVGLLPG